MNTETQYDIFISYSLKDSQFSAIQREKIKGYKYLSVNKIKLAVKNRITANYIDFCLLLKNKLK